MGSENIDKKYGEYELTAITSVGGSAHENPSYIDVDMFCLLHFAMPTTHESIEPKSARRPPIHKDTR